MIEIIRRSENGYQGVGVGIIIKHGLDKGEIVKEFKNPKIDFRALHMFTIGQVKDLRRELF